MIETKKATSETTEKIDNVVIFRNPIWNKVGNIYNLIKINKFNKLMKNIM